MNNLLIVILFATGFITIMGILDLKSREKPQIHINQSHVLHVHRIFHYLPTHSHVPKRSRRCHDSCNLIGFP